MSTMDSVAWLLIGMAMGMVLLIALECALRSQRRDTTSWQGRVYSFDDTPIQGRFTAQQLADMEDK